MFISFHHTSIPMMRVVYKINGQNQIVMTSIFFVMAILKKGKTFLVKILLVNWSILPAGLVKILPACNSTRT